MTRIISTALAVIYSVALEVNEHAITLSEDIIMGD